MENGKGMMLLRNKRMQQLVKMFAFITGKSEQEAEQIILQTDTGMAVKDNNETVLYEQQTENMYSIAMELKQLEGYNELVEMLSKDNIVKAMKCLSNMKVHDVLVMDTPHILAEDAKEERRRRLLQKHRQLLRVRRQNQRNVRRIEHADRIKRQK